MMVEKDFPDLGLRDGMWNIACIRNGLFDDEEEDEA